MSAHLSTQEFVDALEGTLPAAREAHLSSCEACSREMTELTGVAREAHLAGDVPEPSPLFWEHFSARVRTATAEESIRALSWWDRSWRPLVAVSAVAATVVIAVVLHNGRTSLQPANATTMGNVAPAIEPAIDDASMEFMVQMASGASNEELESARPGSDATSAAIGELTAEQQAELIRLITAEIGEQR